MRAEVGALNTPALAMSAGCGAAHAPGKATGVERAWARAVQHQRYEALGGHERPTHPMTRVSADEEAAGVVGELAHDRQGVGRVAQRAAPPPEHPRSLVEQVAAVARQEGVERGMNPRVQEVFGANLLVGGERPEAPEDDPTLDVLSKVCPVVERVHGRSEGT